jgi:sugar lactone lactonase YvrE
VRSIAVVMLLALAALPPGPAAAQTRQPLDIKTFARVGAPGQPEAIAVARDGTVYVGTNQQQRGDTAAPSKIFAYSPAGQLVREYVVEGQDLSVPHGIQGIALDADGIIYALDRTEARDRVFTLDPSTGEQADYAEFRDVPPCPPTGPNGDCAATMATDSGAGPNFPAFGPDGSLYVTDIEQALIWKVPRGGGRPEVFFTDGRLESVFGPNGIQMMGDGRTLMFASTAQSPSAGNPAVGRLWKLPIRPGGRAGELESFWESQPVDGPDGFAIARSGKVYVALAGASKLVVLSAAGEEIARIPGAGQQTDPPFDGPASVAFAGESALVTNQSFPAGNPDNWAVFDVFTGEPGLPLFRPEVSGGPAPPPGLFYNVHLRLVYERGRDRAGRRCAIGRIRATVKGIDRRYVSRATFRFDGRRVAVDRRAPFTAIVRRPRSGPARRHRVVARVKLAAGADVLKRRVRTCARG